MKFKIEQIMRSSYSDIKDSQLILKKKLKDDDFIVENEINTSVPIPSRILKKNN